jgi:cation:H+ antiporter
MVFFILLIVAGFVSLILGANWLVNGASGLARKFNVPDLAIGLTIVAFGTSAPELVVSMIGSLNGYSDIVLGNVIGSNNFNLFIILGLTGIIFPVSVQSSTAWREIPVSLIIAVLLLLLINDFFLTPAGQLSRMEGLFLLVLFFIFLFYVFKQLKKDESAAEEIQHKSLPLIVFFILIGLGGLVLGGHLVVNHSVKLANELGVSKKVIGLTIVAAGTSLPELVTSMVAAFKKNNDIAIGNVIGSNIFNILLILSISGIIRPIDYNAGFNMDIYVLLGGTAFLLISMVTGKRKKLDRVEAGFLFLFYLIYIVYQLVQ